MKKKGDITPTQAGKLNQLVRKEADNTNKIAEAVLKEKNSIAEKEDILTEYIGPKLVSPFDHESTSKIENVEPNESYLLNAVKTFMQNVVEIPSYSKAAGVSNFFRELYTYCLKIPSHF